MRRTDLSRITAAPVGRYWVNVDLHVHSIYSGGSLAPLEILESAGRALLDAVAICDHHEVRGALEGQIIAARTPFLPVVIAAQEISAGDHCHFLLIGSTKAQPGLNRNQIGAVLLRHRQEGGAVILAHPWTALKNSWVKGALREWLTEGLVDGMELGNSALVELDRSSTAMIRAIWDEWVIPYQLAVTGGSDFHYADRSRVIGGGRTYFQVSASDEPGILEALRSRRTVAAVFGKGQIDLPGFASGKQIFWGLEPWCGQLLRFKASLQRTLRERGKYNPKIAGMLWQMVETGQFQTVQEILRKRIL